MEIITDKLWEYARESKSKTLFNWLNEDNIYEVYLDGKVFWWELNSPSTNTTPNKIYDIIKKWGKEQGLTYVYDLN